MGVVLTIRATSELPRSSTRQTSYPRVVDVGYQKPSGAKREQCVGNSRSGAARSQLQDLRQRGTRESLGKAFPKTCLVGIESDQLPASHGNRVDCSHAGRTIGDFVQICDHRLFDGVSDVYPAEAVSREPTQHRSHFRIFESQLGKVEQFV